MIIITIILIVIDKIAFVKRPSAGPAAAALRPGQYGHDPRAGPDPIQGLMV